MLDELLFWVLGLIAGLLAGLIPGLHTNTAAAFLLLLQPAIETKWILFLVGLNVMQACCDFIPAILIGAPESDTALSVQPGHRLFQKGLALHAIQISLVGTLAGFVLGSLLIPLYWLFAIQTQRFWFQTIPWVLLLCMVLLIQSETSTIKKGLAVIAVIASGVLGFIGLRFFSNQLFPLVSGFFGVSTIWVSLQTKTQCTEQKNTSITRLPRRWKTNALFSAISGSLVSLFPALSASHAALASQSFQSRWNHRGFLLANAAINASATLFSFIAVYAIQKSRTGSAVALQTVASPWFLEPLLVVATVLASVGIGILLANRLAQQLVQNLKPMNYRRLSQVALGILVLATLAQSSWTGLVFLALSSALGIFCQRVGIRKSHLMGFLVWPTIVFYLGIS